MTDLNALTLFAKIVEARSFSEAARRLKVPVSTLSRRIAELETELGVRLLERTTRQLRLTDVGAQILHHAQQSAELGALVEGIVSNHRAGITGTLRISAPPSISDSVVAPIVTRFQTEHPAVRVQVFISERTVDPVAESINLSFRVDPVTETARRGRRLLLYRHQLLASPAYLAKRTPPRHPHDLQEHRLLAFARGKPRFSWIFTQAGGTGRETVFFEPQLAMNDYTGLAAALVSGAGIGDLPPIVQPGLLARGELVEVMPAWRFRTFELSLVNFGSKFTPRPVQVFTELAASIAPDLFPDLPT